jgi:rhodanese-related sulfurtransferase
MEIQAECFAIAELRQVLKQLPDKIIVIDVRNPDEFMNMHIPGAINIPLSEIQNHLPELPKQKQIITACGKGGGRSEQAATLLKENGFENTTWLCGGTNGWFSL